MRHHVLSVPAELWCDEKGTWLEGACNSPVRTEGGSVGL